MTLLVPEDQPPSNRKNLAAYLPLLGYVTLAFLVAATAYYFFWKIEGVIEGGKLRDLGAIADTKVKQINTWREVQKRTGESISNDSLLAGEFGQWQEKGMPSNEHKHRIRKLLSELQYANGYKALSLLDKKGVPRISADGDYAPDAEEARLAAQAMGNRKAVFSDFHRGDDAGQGIYIDLIIPLITSGKTGRVVGAAILVIDPNTFLYPLIQSWPTRRGSAETLLVRHEGNEILFLNELHHNKGTPLSLRIPFEKPNFPAAMAVRGETGTTDGIDYRGVAVVAAMREIPGTPWFMVAKIDKAELFAPIDQLKTWATGLGFVIAVLGGGLFFSWLKGIRVRQRLITAQRDAAVEREMLVKHFEYLNKYASDIILVADEAGRIVEANERAVETYGYTREEFLRMEISDLRLPAEDPAIFKRQLEQLGELGELRYETANRRKDGTTFPIEVNARIIEVQGTKYLHGIARDITARKQAEDALRKHETMLRESQRMAQIGSWELDLVNNILSWSDENYRIFEIDRTRFGASYEAFLNIVHPDDRTMVNRAYTDSVKNRTPYDVVHRLLFPDQRVKYVREWCETIYDQEGRPIRSIGTTQDVTGHKLDEEALRESENRYRLLVESSPFGIHEIDLEGRLQSMNRAGLGMLGLDDAGKVCGMPYLELVSWRDAGRIGTLLWDAITNGSLSHFEFSATGDVPRYFKSCFIPIKGADGKVLRLMSITEDITERRQAEQLFHQQKNFIRRVIDTDPNLIAVRDAKGKFLLANQAVATLYGMEPQELVGRNVAELFPAGDQLDAILRTDCEVIEKRSPIEFVEHDSRDGMNRWFRVAKVPMEQPDGSVHVLGIAVDITENRLAAEKLLKSAEDIEDLYDNAPCGYHSLDKDGIFARINNTELKWLGYTRNELVGQRNFQDILTPSSGNRFQQYFRKYRGEGGVQELEVDVLRRDGTVLPVLLTETAIYDPEGHFVMSRSTMFDITTRRLAEVALRESENLFRTTVDNAPIIIWVAEVSDERAYQGCNFFNQRWHDFTGHAREETQVRDWVRYVHPDDAERCLDVYSKAIGQIQPFKLEYRLRRQDGIYRWMLDSGIPRFTEEGDFSGYIGTCVDITEQKQFENMREKMEHVGRLNIAGEMASSMAHELSQPLTACSNYLDGCLRRMEENDWNREKLHRAVQLAHKQSERAGKIINHLKEMVRKQGHERVLIDVNQLARDVVTFLEDEIKRQGISVHMALFPLPKVMACKVEIEQVLLNLCKNAIESMHSCPQRELRLSTGVVESGEILVTVSDSGSGIPAGGMESLFNPFQSSKRDGLGLGLAICRSFVENHGGRIWADTQREFGAEFYFTLPIGAEHE
ncbi:PAS domain S-box protein [Candidatus Ferrigenium straubiae]|jgi:PAS domain S-box-containing protein|uniref:PAS domain S-box protein n=1 Tax=Candidatus Ferrigenium straubiae TaxID=2919506 RepID=UPI003F4A983A